MKKFIVIQMKVDSRKLEEGRETTLMSNIVRRVKAESKEEAIGKFIIDTLDSKADQKLDVECYELTDIKKL